MTETRNLDWLVSVDDHILEPRNLWQDRMPAKFKEAAPRIIVENGKEFWQYEGHRRATMGLFAVAGKSKEQFSPDGLSYDDMRDGCYDPRARLADMDQAGIAASLSFPTFPRFCGQLFHEAQDKELALLCVKAWNDWLFDEWCATAPDRFIPMILIPLWDPAAAVKEIERTAPLGARALAFSENPAPLGLPTIQDKNRYWDPVWAAAQEAQLVVCMHQGSSSSHPQFAPDSPQLAITSWSMGSESSGALLEWLFSPVFHRFPNLKIALSEGGIGWMPYFLERAEHVVATQRYWASQAETTYDLATGNVVRGGKPEVDLMTLDIRQLFRDHVYGCFIEDAAGINNLELLGADNVMIETDYPHSDTTWPNSITVARKQLAGLDEETQYKVLRGNAERLYRFDAAFK